MRLEGTHVLVTGGGSGIGRALALRAAHEGARAVTVLDLGDGAHDTAKMVEVAGADGLGVVNDVTDGSAVAAAVAAATSRFGAVDFACANAGVALGTGLESPDGIWQKCWDVNVVGVVHLARAVLPDMAARQRGAFLVTASAAGLLTSLDSAPYAVTKHAAVALAEWLAITYADAGVQLHCLCPQGVRTPMIETAGVGASTLAAGALLEPEEVADSVVEALRRGQFLVLPHPEVAGFEQKRAADRDKWIAGMARWRARLPGRPRGQGTARQGTSAGQGT